MRLLYKLKHLFFYSNTIHKFHYYPYSFLTVNERSLNEEYRVQKSIELKTFQTSQTKYVSGKKKKIYVYYF